MWFLMFTTSKLPKIIYCISVSHHGTRRICFSQVWVILFSVVSYSLRGPLRMSKQSHPCLFRSSKSQDMFITNMSIKFPKIVHSYYIDINKHEQTHPPSNFIPISIIYPFISSNEYPFIKCVFKCGIFHC